MFHMLSEVNYDIFKKCLCCALTLYAIDNFALNILELTDTGIGNGAGRPGGVSPAGDGVHAVLVPGAHRLELLPKGAALVPVGK